jgi:hypothetical protein
MRLLWLVLVLSVSSATAHIPQQEASFTKEQLLQMIEECLKFAVLWEALPASVVDGAVLTCQSCGLRQPARRLAQEMAARQYSQSIEQIKKCMLMPGITRESLRDVILKAANDTCMPCGTCKTWAKWF